VTGQLAHVALPLGLSCLLLRCPSNPGQLSNGYDNVPVEECFFSSLKNELVRHRQFQNQAEARYPIAEYIEHFYNRPGLLPALDYWSLEEFEQMAGES
jgi:transposase InsO family protein